MPGPNLNQQLAKNFSQGLQQSTGLLGLKKMIGMENTENPLKAALMKRQEKLNEMKDNYAGSNSVY